MEDGTLFCNNSYSFASTMNDSATTTEPTPGRSVGDPCTFYAGAYCDTPCIPLDWASPPQWLYDGSTLNPIETADCRGADDSYAYAVANNHPTSGSVFFWGVPTWQDGTVVEPGTEVYIISLGAAQANGSTCLSLEAENDIRLAAGRTVSVYVEYTYTYTGIDNDGYTYYGPPQKANAMCSFNSPPDQCIAVSTPAAPTKFCHPRVSMKRDLAPSPPGQAMCTTVSCMDVGYPYGDTSCLPYCGTHGECSAVEPLNYAPEWEEYINVDEFITKKNLYINSWGKRVKQGNTAVSATVNDTINDAVASYDSMIDPECPDGYVLYFDGINQTSGDPRSYWLSNSARGLCFPENCSFVGAFMPPLSTEAVLSISFDGGGVYDQAEALSLYIQAFSQLNSCEQDIFWLAQDIFGGLEANDPCNPVAGLINSAADAANAMLGSSATSRLTGQPWVTPVLVRRGCSDSPTCYDSNGNVFVTTYPHTSTPPPTTASSRVARCVTTFGTGVEVWPTPGQGLQQEWTMSYGGNALLLTGGCWLMYPIAGMGYRAQMIPPPMWPAFTVSVWFSPQLGAAGPMCVFSIAHHELDGTGAVELSVSPTPTNGTQFLLNLTLCGRQACYSLAPGTPIALGTYGGSATNGTYTHAVVAVDSHGAAKLYVNSALFGVLQPVVDAAVAGVHNAPTSTMCNVLVLGADPGAQSTFSGLIDDVQVFMGVVPPVQISSLSMCGQPLCPISGVGQVGTPYMFFSVDKSSSPVWTSMNDNNNFDFSPAGSTVSSLGLALSWDDELTWKQPACVWLDPPPPCDPSKSGVPHRLSAGDFSKLQSSTASPPVLVAPVSIATWVLSTDSMPYTTLWDVGFSPGGVGCCGIPSYLGGYSMSLSVGGDFYSAVLNVTAWGASWGVSIPGFWVDGEWQHVTVTIDAAGNVQVYSDFELMVNVGETTHGDEGARRQFASALDGVNEWNNILLGASQQQGLVGPQVPYSMFNGHVGSFQVYSDKLLNATEVFGLWAALS